MSATTTTAAEELLAKAERLREIIVDELRSLAAEAETLVKQIEAIAGGRMHEGVLQPGAVRVAYIDGIVSQARDVAGMLRFDSDPPSSWAVAEQDADDLVALVEDAIRRCTPNGKEA